MLEPSCLLLPAYANKNSKGIQIAAGHVGPVEQLAVHASCVFSDVPTRDNDIPCANQRTGAEEL